MATNLTDRYRQQFGGQSRNSTKKRQKTDQEEYDEIMRGREVASRVGSREVSQEGQEANSLLSFFGDAASRVAGRSTQYPMWSQLTGVPQLYEIGKEAFRGLQTAGQGMAEGLSFLGEPGPMEQTVQEQFEDDGGMSDEEAQELVGQVDLSGEYATGAQAPPGRQVTAEAGSLQLLEGGDEAPLITDIRPGPYGGREGATEGPVQFGDQRGFASAGASDAEMLEAMGGAPSKKMVDEAQKLADLAQTEARLEAGDYSGMSSQEFSEALEEGGVPESQDAEIQAWQKAAQEWHDRYGPSQPSEIARGSQYAGRRGVDVPDEFGWMEESMRGIQRQVEEGELSEEMAQEQIAMLSDMAGEYMASQRLGEELEAKEDIQQMQISQAIEEAWLEQVGEAATGEEASLPSDFDAQKIWERGFNQARTEVDGFEEMNQTDQLEEVMKRIEATQPPRVAAQLRRMFLGTPGQQQGGGQNSDIVQALKGNRSQ